MWALGQDLFMSEEGSHNTFNFLYRYISGILCPGSSPRSCEMHPSALSWCSEARCKHQTLSTEEAEACLDPTNTPAVPQGHQWQPLKVSTGARERLGELLG